MAVGRTSNFADDHDDGDLLVYAEHADLENPDEQLGHAIEHGGGRSAFTALPSKAGAAAAEVRSRRWLYVLVPVLVIVAFAAFSGMWHDKHPKKAGPAPVLGVAHPPNATALKHAKKELAPTVTTVPVHTIRVIAKHPHDPTAFTQGLEYAHGYLWESTGLRGSSSLRRVRLDDGVVEQKYVFRDRNLFGEGITLHHNHHIFMLSWQAGRGFIFDQNSFKLLREWHYKGQGWGLTMHDSAEEVWMSDGTDVLRVLEPENLGEKRRIHVTLDGKPARELNEIEWVCGEIWANVWRTKLIYRIDPHTGHVKAIVNCESLPLSADVVLGQNVLNGIAFDWESGRLWLTGKKWSKLYQVHVNDPSLDLTHCKP